MKRITKLLSAAIITTASAGAMAQFPSSANETTPLVSIFPNTITYADLHRSDSIRIANVPYPSSANETTAMAAEFPHIVTYADLHKNDPVVQAAAPFPSSAPETTALSATVPPVKTFADLHDEAVRRASSSASPPAM